MVTGFRELAFSPIELLSIDPKEFYSVREITRALRIAEDELATIGDEQPNITYRIGEINERIS